MEWLLAHADLVIQVAIVVVATVYALSQGKALVLVGQAWGLIVDVASGWLAKIPAEEFVVWAQMIHKALPVWAKLFVSVEQIAGVLKNWRDAILATGGMRAMELGPAEDGVGVGGVMAEVRAELAGMLGL